MKQAILELFSRDLMRLRKCLHLSKELVQRHRDLQQADRPGGSGAQILLQNVPRDRAAATAKLLVHRCDVDMTCDAQYRRRLEVGSNFHARLP